MLWRVCWGRPGDNAGLCQISVAPAESTGETAPLERADLDSFSCFGLSFPRAGRSSENLAGSFTGTSSPVMAYSRNLPLDRDAGRLQAAPVTGSGAEKATGGFLNRSRNLDSRWNSGMLDAYNLSRSDRDGCLNSENVFPSQPMLADLKGERFEGGGFRSRGPLPCRPLPAGAREASFGKTDHSGRRAVRTDVCARRRGSDLRMSRGVLPHHRAGSFASPFDRPAASVDSRLTRFAPCGFVGWALPTNQTVRTVLVGNAHPTGRASATSRLI
jgi:hypothetical protein